MIRAHDFEKIKTWPVRVRRPGGPTGPGVDQFVIGTLEDLAEDLLDFHLDLKKIIQQHDKKALKYRVTIHRQPLQFSNRYFPTFAPADYAGEDLGDGSTSFSISAGDGSFSNGIITGAGTARHWSVTWAPAGGTPITVEEGDFVIPANTLSASIEVVDDLKDIEMVRLNYAVFLDKNIAKKIETPPLTNLVLEVDSINGIGSFTDSLIRPTDVTPSIRFYGTSTTPVEISLGTKSLTTQAGLFYSEGLRIRITSKLDKDRWVEGRITQYNTDANNKFRHSAAQIDNNIRTFGCVGELIRSTDGTTIVPAIQRMFAAGDPTPNFRKGVPFIDELSERISFPGLSDFDLISGNLTVFENAPYWGAGAPDGVWTNAGHVAEATYTWVGFTEMAATSYGLKIGYGHKTRDSIGPEGLAISGGLEFVTP